MTQLFPRFRAFLAPFIVLVLLAGCGSCEQPDEQPVDVDVTMCETAPACALGEYSCGEANGVLECVTDEAGCLVWSSEPVEVCEEGLQCFNGGCFTSEKIPCVNRCVEGQVACDEAGRVVRCTKEDVCPAFNEVVEECSGEELCYRGECVEPPEVSLPATPADNTQSILSVGKISYPLDPRLVVIPHDAFMAAIRGRYFSELPKETDSGFVDVSPENAVHDVIDLGLQTIIDANDTNVVGGYAHVEEAEDTFFKGDIFLVPMDARYSDEVSLAPFASISPSRVEFQRFNVYIAKGLSGHTPYKFTSTTLVGVAQLGLPSGSCCNSPGGERTCDFVEPGLGPFGGDSPCQFGAWGDCPPTPVSAWENLTFPEDPNQPAFPEEPEAQPFRMGFGSSVVEDELGLTPLLLKKGNGLPASILYTFEHRSKHDSSGWDRNDAREPEENYPTNAAGLTYLNIKELLRGPAGVVCEQCTKSLCPETGGRISPDDFPDSIPTSCGSVSKTPVPLLCQQISGSGMNMPSECAGACLGCFGGEDSNANPAGISPGFCHHSVGGGTMYSEFPGGASGGSGGGCTAPGVPSYCQFASPVEGGACSCNGDCQAEQAEMWSELVGCGATGGTASPGYECCSTGDSCVCRSSSEGQWCTVCNENGDCYEIVQDNLVDGDVAATHKWIFTKADGSQVVMTCTDDEACTVSEQVITLEALHVEAQIPNQEGEKPKTTASKKSAKSLPEDEIDDPGSEEPPPSKEPDDKIVDTAPEDPTTAPAQVDADVERKKKEGGFVDGVIEGVKAVVSKAADMLEKVESTSAEQVASADITKQSSVDSTGSGKPSQDEEGDPVLVPSGDFLLQHKDLSFPGPVRPLEFSRQYLSQSGDRSVLGSNWTHNFDIRVLPIKEGNAADWMPHYCKNNTPYTTCALVKQGNGPARLFVLDPASTSIQQKLMFMPQAGSTDTLYFEGERWLLRKANGHAYVFNEFGYLIEDRDRFGNGFVIEYDPTPVFALYKRWCDATSEEARIYQQQVNNFDWRFCQYAGWLFGDRSQPQISEDGFEPFITDPQTGASRPTISFPIENPLGLFLDREPDLSIDDPSSNQGVSAAARMICLRSGRPEGSSIDSCVLAVTLQMALDMGVVRSFLSKEILPRIQTGDRKMRPVKVRDDLGRTLSFDYYDDAVDEESYGLLEAVSGPGGANVSFEYARPSDAVYPTRLNESFLVRVVREDAATNVRNTENGPLKTIDFVYNWPSTSMFDSFDSGGIFDKLVEDYARFYRTYTGCTLNPNGGSVVCRAAPGVSQVCGNDGRLLYMSSGMPQTQTGCSVTASSRRPGNTPQLATFQAHEWVSQVADNIVQVKYNGVLESETVYEVDPYEFDFDRVRMQRYGGLSLADYDPDVRKPHASTNEPWTTDLPEFEFSYLKARPVDLNDTPTDVSETSTFLPTEVADRYPLESIPEGFGWKDYDLCMVDEASCERWSPPEEEEDGVYTPSLGHDVPACRLNMRSIYKKSLPQWHPQMPYYTLQDGASDLQRSRLSCQQLAEIHSGDATHNGLIHGFDNIQGQVRWKLLQGDRRNIEADLKRICAWTKVVDRDGRERLYGLNFKGLTVVEAIHEPVDGAQGEYLFGEMLYNADGNLREQREPTRGSSPWVPDDGYATLDYDEYIQPNGPEDWDYWLPFWWTRRDNITRIENFPNRSVGGISYAHEWDGVSLKGDQLLSTRVEMRYEPVFNQLRTSEFGVVTDAGGSTYEGQSQIFYDFDYQEFARDGRDFCLNMAAFNRFGFNPMFRTQLVDGKLGIDPSCDPELTAWQFPLPFYEENLNGDAFTDSAGASNEIIGSPKFSDVLGGAIKGVPVRITSRDLRTGQEQQTFISYSPNGRPSHIQYPSGAMTDYRFYRFDPDGTRADDDKYGVMAPKESAKASSLYRGLLAQVIHKRFDHEYAEELGPGASTGHTRCDALSGPYQWMLPGGCQDEAEAKVKLDQMGVPSEVQELVFKLVNPEEDQHWSTQTYSYAQTGHPILTWSDGRTLTAYRDVDGRVVSSTDAIGNATSYTRDRNGRVREVLVQDAFFAQLSKVRYEYDNEGHLLTKCVEVNPGGCTNVLPLSSLPFDPDSDAPVGYTTPRVGIDENPDYLLTTYRYTPEGLLHGMISPDGVETKTRRNKRGLPIEITALPSLAAGAVAGESRITTHTYDEIGNIEKTERSSSDPSTPSFTEEYLYDGFYRLRRVTDTRGTSWHAAFDARGRTSAFKQDDRLASYGTTHNVDPSRWERFFEYGRTVDANGLHHVSVTQGPITTIHRMDNTGRVISTEGTGVSRQWFAYDNSGRSVWSMDETGAQSLSFSQLDVAPGAASSELRLPHAYGVAISTHSEDGSYRASTSISAFDQGGRITRSTRVGVGQTGPELRQVTLMDTDSLGRVIRQVNPEGVTSSMKRNLLGWPTQVTRAGPNGGDDITQHVYNARGQRAQTIDPKGEVTTWEYGWDGQKTARFLSTSPNVAHESYAYDGLGRLVQLSKKPGQTGSESLGYHYDARGDLTRIHTLDSNGAQVDHMRSAYDDLGRVTDAWSHNPGSSGHTHPVAHTMYVRDGIGRILEERTMLEDSSGVSAHQHSVLYEHNLVQGSGGLDTWEKQVTYPSGKTVTRIKDRVGRLSLLTVGSSLSSITSSVDMHWLGGMSAGRTHDYGGADPLEEDRVFDGLGRLASLDYRAVELDPMTQQPLDTTWGQEYCQGVWGTSCAAPVWNVALKHDVMSRVAASKRAFTHPLRDLQDDLVPVSEHRRLYRGYEYNDRGHLIGEWHKSQAAESEFDGLINHQIQDSDLSALGGTNWLWERESNVGSLEAVVNASDANDTRWRHIDSSGDISERLTGYRLDAVEVDGQSGAITHDIHNRITSDLDHSYSFDAMNRLTEVRGVSNVLLESYLYDANGRMIVRSTSGVEELYVHDGAQMIAAYDRTNSSLTWEAVWGAGLDQLLEWEQGGTTHVAMRDERNSIIGLWNANQRNLGAMAEYDAFGRTRILSQDESVSCEEEGSGTTCMMLAGDMPFGFNSAWRSEATGLIFMRNRWYSPTLGQFVSLDPLGTIDSHNMYAFAAFDPINGWDPYGLSTKDFTEGTSITPVTPPGPFMPPPGTFPDVGPNPAPDTGPKQAPRSAPSPRVPGAGPGVGGIAARVLGFVTPAVAAVAVAVGIVFYPRNAGNGTPPKAYRERMDRQRLAERIAAGARTSPTPGLDKGLENEPEDDDDDDDEQVYKIKEGVRRSKAAELAGKSTIKAMVYIGDMPGEIKEIPIKNLRSPKSKIDISDQDKMDRWMNVWKGTEDGDIMPPIDVEPGDEGVPIKSVDFELYDPF